MFAMLSKELALQGGIMYQKAEPEPCQLTEDQRIESDFSTSFFMKRSRSLREELRASGRACYVDERAFATLPYANSGEVRIQFFRVMSRLRAREIR